MSTPQNFKFSSLLALVYAFLLPIFFIPSQVFTLEISKLGFIAIGTIILGLVFLFEFWRVKEIYLPYPKFMISLAILSVIYLASSLVSTTPTLSLFGYYFEIGTFGYILIVSITLILFSIIVTEFTQSLKVLFALLASFSIVILFAVIKLIFNGAPVLGVFFAATDGPMGGWTDLAMLVGLLSPLSILVLGMIPTTKVLRILTYITFAISTTLLLLLHFTLSLWLVIAAAILLVVYFHVIERTSLASTGHSSEAKKNRTPIVLSIILIVLSLIFAINPNVSTNTSLGDFIATKTGLANLEVRPSLSATLDVSKAVLSKGVFLGSGPNTFRHDWLVYKPIEINQTPFWGVAFPFGIGFVLTQIVSTGILGGIAWLGIILFLIFIAVRALLNLPESRIARFTIVTYVLATAYLWFACLVYVPSSSMLAVTFIITGLLLSLSAQLNDNSQKKISLPTEKLKKVFAHGALGVIMLSLVFIGFTFSKKFVAAYHFQKATNLSNSSSPDLTKIEEEILEAISASEADVHYIALSRVYFSMAQSAVNDSTRSPQENQTIFQEAVKKNIESAQKAVNLNPEGYQNWLILGIIYSALVPEPFSISGVYENAKIAYNEALSRNPLNPETHLLLAQLEWNKKDIESARSYIRQAIALKNDYIDAYSMLAQLEIQQNNLQEAINSAEKIASLTPDNPGIHFELGLLRYSNGSYSGAEDALKQALVLRPDYANAQYYLGLSLAKLGRLDEALAQFEAIAVTNPDNAEVEAIIDMLKAGKNLF